jgi:hypothetical protein
VKDVNGKLSSGTLKEGDHAFDRISSASPLLSATILPADGVDFDPAVSQHSDRLCVRQGGCIAIDSFSE